MKVMDMAMDIMTRISSMGAVPAEPILNALNSSVHILALRLADRQSDLAQGSLSSAISESSFTLPEYFNGFVDKPKADNKEMDPVPNDYDESTPKGTPKYYKVIDDTLFIYPTPLVSTNIVADYWVMPDTLTLSSDLPYSGKFDALLKEMSVKIAIVGFTVMSEQSFIITMEQGLDLIVFPRRPSLPKYRQHSYF